MKKKKRIYVSGHTGTIRSSVTADMNLIGERFFWYRSVSYRYRVQCDRGFKGELRPEISLLHMKVLTLIKAKNNVFL